MVGIGFTLFLADCIYTACACEGSRSRKTVGVLRKISLFFCLIDCSLLASWHIPVIRIPYSRNGSGSRKKKGRRQMAKEPIVSRDNYDFLCVYPRDQRAGPSCFESLDNLPDNGGCFLHVINAPCFSLRRSFETK